MGLVSGMFMGMVFGISLMAGWRHMIKYRSTKRIAKAADIKILGALSRDDLKKICGDNYPEWISFPVYEQVKWLNKHLSKLWPFVAEAASAVIKESVEPLLEEYRPPGITSLKFSKLSLGTVAPKIEGIRVQNLKKGQITMDIDLRWGGDPSIILGVEAALVASIPIQLKNLQVFTVVRVIFQLAEEIPCISAVVVALLAEPKPRIDYTLKAVGGSLTAVPGISDMIDVFDQDIGQDKRLGIAKFRLIELEPETPKEVNLNLLSSLDTLKIKDNKDRGSCTIKLLYHQFNKEEQLIALEEEKRILEERKRLKEAGVIGSTMDALDGAASLVGSGVGMVGTGIGTGVGLVGSGVSAGVGMVGSGLSKAGKFMGRTVTGHSSKKSETTTTPDESKEENGGAKPQ
ncbi:hypothetical protein E1A91_D08G043000v1 [Gossypium mustelinum]|uniref:SMP-LTD domain-containing protein n=1 Tax=Gossypium mustelinum TaxID=34275 RepID=A0A5D2TUF4_GOSMU|nr:hypothetical protein E1A91_D08G043000v1 [Gossypium mustelinum]